MSQDIKNLWNVPPWKQLKAGDTVKVGNGAAKKGKVLQIEGAICKVEYPDGTTAIVPVSQVRK